MPDYRTMYDKDYIGAWDLVKGDMTVTIKKVTGGTLTSVGGRKSKKPVVYMTHTEKGFALNATNGKTIAGLYGNLTEKWIGKQITLYKSMTRDPSGGGEVECIRVRPVVPSGSAAAPLSLDVVLAAIGAIKDKESQQKAKAMAEALTDEADAEAAFTAYKNKVQEIKAAAAATPADDFVAQMEAAESEKPI